MYRNHKYITILESNQKGDTVIQIMSTLQMKLNQQQWIDNAFAKTHYILLTGDDYVGKRILCVNIHGIADNSITQ